MHKPTTGTYPEYYQRYIDNVQDNNVLDALNSTLTEGLAIIKSIPADKANHAYADGKWTVKELLIHIIDTERIFAYRAMRFSRGDSQALAGFEQDDYILHANAANRSLESIVSEYEHLRLSNIALFGSYDAAQLDRIGKGNKFDVSVRAILYVMCGHQIHHLNVLKERYLN